MFSWPIRGVAYLPVKTNLCQMHKIWTACASNVDCHAQSMGLGYRTIEKDAQCTQGLKR